MNISTDNKGFRNLDSGQDSYAHQCAALVEKLASRLLEADWSITTAESCTAGMLAAALTDLPGSSAWFERGAVTYSNIAKNEMLGVPMEIFSTDGAVSKACVRAMAAGALSAAGANVAVSISGVAGPDGGSADKPVGTVWIGWALMLSTRAFDNAEQGAETVGKASITARQYHYEGARNRVREQAVLQALRDTIDILEHADFQDRKT